MVLKQEYPVRILSANGLTNLLRYHTRQGKTYLRDRRAA